MFLFQDRKRQALRARAEHPVDVRMPLRIGSEEALAHLAEPLAEAMKSEGAGRLTGRAISCDKAGRPRAVELTFTLRAMDLRALETLGRALEAIGAPCGSTATMSETGLRHLFGRTEGLGVALPETAPTGTAARACMAALAGEGRFLGAAREDDGQMLYFYGESYVRMSSRIGMAMRQEPLLTEAVTLRLS